MTADIRHMSYDDVEQINKRSNKMTTEKPVKVKKNGSSKPRIVTPSYDSAGHRSATAEELTQALAPVRLKTEFSRWLNELEIGGGFVVPGDINRLKQKVSVFQKTHGRKYAVKSGDNGLVIVARLQDPEPEAEVENEPAQEESFA